MSATPAVSLPCAAAKNNLTASSPLKPLPELTLKVHYLKVWSMGLASLIHQPLYSLSCVPLPNLVPAITSCVLLTRHVVITSNVLLTSYVLLTIDINQ